MTVTVHPAAMAASMAATMETILFNTLKGGTVGWATTVFMQQQPQQVETIGGKRMVHLSTGLAMRLKVLGMCTEAMDELLMNDSLVCIYAGNPPKNADEPATGRLLVEAHPGSPSGWSGTPWLSATASYFRVVAPGDDGGYSENALRIQGDIGGAGEAKDMTFSTPHLNAGSVLSVSPFNWTWG